MIKFIYSEKDTKFCEISTVDLSCVVPVKSMVEILQNFVAFSKYMNFMIESLLHRRFCLIVGGEVGLSTEEVVACKIVEHLKKT